MLLILMLLVIMLSADGFAEHVADGVAEHVIDDFINGDIDFVANVVAYNVDDHVGVYVCSC